MKATPLTFAIFGLIFGSISGFAQEEQQPSVASPKAAVSSAKTGDDATTIIIHPHHPPQEKPALFTVGAEATAKITTERIEQTITASITVIQGNAENLSLGLRGAGEVVDVQAIGLQSWAIRQTESKRFLDLQVDEQKTEMKAVIKIRSAPLQLPQKIELTHLAKGEAVGFDSVLELQYAAEIDRKPVSIDGFVPLQTEGQVDRFQSATGGRLQLALTPAGSSPGPVEWSDTSLTGVVDPDSQSIRFQFRGTATVNAAGAKTTILSGDAAVSKIPNDASYQLRLANAQNQPVYEIVFADAGTVPVTIHFVAAISEPKTNWRGIDFTVAGDAVVPLELSGLDEELQFHCDQQSVVPIHKQDRWLGFLPASGRAKLQWKTARQTTTGKLFLTTTGTVETQVSAGLVKQEHLIDYRVLQGELKSLQLRIDGPGELLDVRGEHLVSWEIVRQDAKRELRVKLSQPVTTASRISIRSQTALGTFPVRVEGLRLTPNGTIRHSGYLRISNLGSVRIEPTGLQGMTQLAPEQYPSGPIKARQVFAYRFPAADYHFEMVANRIEPEVSVSELVLYEVTQTDRSIRADIELDIREASIRQWDIEVPADYSVVSVTGAAVADHVVATEFSAGRRNVKVVFAQDITGRRLVSLHLEKNQAVDDQAWKLPRIEHPEAKIVRGDLGIVGAAGFRINVEQTERLVEKPLAYFSKSTANLQQVFRIREPDWSATVQIQRLDRAVQADSFHLYSLSQGTVYGSTLINYFVTGAPVSQWKITVPAELENVMVDGQNIRTWRRDGETLLVSLHQPVMGAYTLLVTFEEKPGDHDNTFLPGQITPLEVQGERGYVQVVSPMQVDIKTQSISNDLLVLDPLELPAEFRLLSAAPSLGTWQYTQRPFDLKLNVNWFQPGTMVGQVVEFSEANSRVSQDGELVTDVIYYIKSRGQRTFKVQLPDPPVRLWEVSVDGQPVTARQAEKITLIPLPGNADPNVPIQVSLRLGKPKASSSHAALSLPTAMAPILKTQWNLVGDEQRVLVPSGGTVTPAVPVRRPSGFYWTARRGVLPLLAIALLTILGIFMCSNEGRWRGVGVGSLTVAAFVSFATATIALRETTTPSPLQVTIPILPSGEQIQLNVQNLPLWMVNLSWTGCLSILFGVSLIAWSLWRKHNLLTEQAVAILLIALGVLLQGDGACWFFALLGILLLGCLVRPAWLWGQSFKKQTQPDQDDGGSDASTSDFAPITATILILSLTLALSASPGHAADHAQAKRSTETNEATLKIETASFADVDIEAADRIDQHWQVTHDDQHLRASGTITVSGQPGDQFLLLKAPAVLTKFDGQGLRLLKKQITDHGLTYVISLPLAEEQANGKEPDRPATKVADQKYQATFEYLLEALTPTAGIPVLTGTAAVQTIHLTSDQAGWKVTSPAAVRVQSFPQDNENKKIDQASTRAEILLGPSPAVVFLKPQVRDVTTEATEFFVESAHLYVPGPGVVDGRHRLQIRPSQGQVHDLSVTVPENMTVSAVEGPVSAWQFDAETGRLKLQIEPAQSQTFQVVIDTQRGLDPLPTDVTINPLKVEGAGDEVGLVGLAFGPDAQPEKSQPITMSAVNVGDFDPRLMGKRQAVLHRVYRYGAQGGQVKLRVAPVKPEVRVTSEQVLSLGDERIVMNVNFSADISRAGLFQLSFPLPDGFEVESLSGAALHHWAELSEGEQRQIILHLNGQTIGPQKFTLVLSNTTPVKIGQWQIPRFVLNEADRQTGRLVISPATGIRLRTLSRQNVSETDPRILGGKIQGALAFGLLQRDWDLLLDIEKLQPWITGQVLHEVTLREGQTRSVIMANFQVQNASIRTLRVSIPNQSNDEIKTLRVTGTAVSDFVRTAPDSNVWEIQFKRRVFGSVPVRIEYERRGDHPNEQESLKLVEFPDIRQLSYHSCLRAGGRLEIEYETLPSGWQKTDWNTVPRILREAENPATPTLTLRAVTPANPLTLTVKRHSLADALKLRVAKGTLTTILSPTGDQLTAVEVTMDVIQRSSLNVGLPTGGDLFSVFVNGESVHSIRAGENAWQFNILPGIDDRTANVRFIYSVTGDQLKKLSLRSPKLNVPLENIEWNVIAPKGFELTKSDGDLELIRQTNQAVYDRKSYLSKMSGKRKNQAQQASQLLQQANQLLQAGQQSLARRAFKSVANRYALDAASNEDARVQLENLQTQQAVVGLNTRRQRLYLDNDDEETIPLGGGEQIRQAAQGNPILQQAKTNYSPQQVSDLLQGNTSEDNAVLQRIAARLVQHQRTTEPAPRAILISLPEEGTVYAFRRSVQVSENAPLGLDLKFAKQLRTPLWQTSLVLAALVAIARFTSQSLLQRKTKNVSFSGGLS